VMKTEINYHRTEVTLMEKKQQDIEMNEVTCQ
jgi:hypothetical protein